MAFVMLSVGSFAQDKAAAKPKKGASKKEAKKDAPASDKKEGEAKGGKMKKDGTPDMRHKENKTAKDAKPAGPLKKDGTPDMRHKANKEAAKKK